MSPFYSQYLLAFCGDCEWNVRVEMPDPNDQARIVRQAKAHERDEGHNVAVERSQIYGQRAR